MSIPHGFVRLILAGSLLLLSACATQPAGMPNTIMNGTPAAMQATSSMPQFSSEKADWLDAPLTNAVTGQAFKVSDYSGKVVLVETMAVWCTTCRAQQEQIRMLHQQMAGKTQDLVSVSVDIDPHEDMKALKAYVSTIGFDWAFAVAPADLAAKLARTYGDQFLNPPSAPMLLLDRHGVAHPLPYGVKSAEALRSAAQPYLDAGK